MDLNKFIVLVAKDRAPLAPFAAKLEENNCHIQVFSDPAEAHAHINSTHELSLVVIDGAHVEPEFFCELRRGHPDMEVIWLATEELPRPDFGMHEIERVCKYPLEEEDLFKGLDDLLREHYPASLTQSLISAANSVMVTTFQKSVEVGQPYLKLAGTLPGTINAYLPFMSEKALGHLMISAPEDHLAQLGYTIGFVEDEGQRNVAQEAIQELCNQVGGRIKADCRAYLGSTRLALPLIFAGNEMIVRHPGSKPGLCIEVDDGDGRIHFEYSFTQATMEFVQTDFQAPGEVLLFDEESA